jgi:glycosyltransferase involved in cell wall biosynthesis
MMDSMEVSVIVTTYNLPQWLEKVIWGFAVQTHRWFELVIADDGSTEATTRKIVELRQRTGLAIRHVWHEDRGFRKCEILNKAIIASAYDYLVFTDGDCIPRNDFLAQHVTLARPGCFLSGGVVRLPLSLSWQLSHEDIQSGRAMDARWLRDQGMPWSKKLWLLARDPRLAAWLDCVTTTRATFNGHNASAWKNDMLRVNGFNEQMHYGGLDRELGERLVNAGLRGRQVRHRAVCVHLEHPRVYASNTGWRRNQKIREETMSARSIWTAQGLQKSSAPLRRSHPTKKAA